MIEQLTIKEQLQNLLALEFDLNDFYAITLREEEIRLQGRATEGVLNKLKSLDYELNFNKEYNWISATKNQVTCTLTFNS